MTAARQFLSALERDRRVVWDLPDEVLRSLPIPSRRPKVLAVFYGMALGNSAVLKRLYTPAWIAFGDAVNGAVLDIRRSQEGDFSGVIPAVADQVIGFSDLSTGSAVGRKDAESNALIALERLSNVIWDKPGAINSATRDDLVAYLSGVKEATQSVLRPYVRGINQPFFHWGNRLTGIRMVDLPSDFPQSIDKAVEADEFGD